MTSNHADTRVVVVGIGKSDELDSERAHNYAAAGVKSLWRSNAKRVAIVVPGGGGPQARSVGAIDEARATQSVVEGAIYASWRPEVHRTREEDRRIAPIETVLVVSAKPQAGAIATGEAVGEAVNLQRRLANEPANKMTPTVVATEARAAAAGTGVQVEILDRAACRKLGMGSYLSVAQGSHEEPRFVVMRYRGRKNAKGFDVGYVGKGITFDSGGISIKPADNMHHMKADMTGAASVIAAIVAIAKLRLPVNVIAVAPCTENLPGGGATKPGDVFTAMSGKTVEVINTDAEGRLVLVDGMTYAQREGAKRVVDVATLTGAISVAVGPYFIGLFGQPRSFVDDVLRVATEAGDRLWPMPLTQEYKDEIKGEVADIRNSAGREGGAIKAAAFLWSAVEDGTEWAHLDIASVDWSDRDRPYAPRGPQGPSVRTLVALAQSLSNGGVTK